MEVNNKAENFATADLPNFIKHHLTAFQFLGFVHIKFSMSSTSSSIRKLLISSAVIKNLVAQLLIFFTYIYQDYIFYNGHGFGKFCDIFKVVFCALAYEALFIECWWNGSAEQLICNMSMLRVDKEDGKMTFARFKWFFVKLYTYVFIWLSIEIIYVYVKRDDSQAVNIWCIYNFLVFTTRTRTMHFMYILRVINCKAEMLNEELAKLVEDSKVIGGRGSDLRQRLTSLRKRHLGLLRMVDIFNESFKWGLIFNHFRIYTKMIVDIYWNIFVYYMHTHPIGRVSNFIQKKSLTFFDKFIELYAIVPTLIELSMFLGVCQDLEKEFSRIGFFVHDVDLDGKDDLRVHIENFSLQALAGPYKIRALGCFDFNCGAAKNVCVMVLTM